MEIIVTTDRTLLANHSNRNTAHPASPATAHGRAQASPRAQAALRCEARPGGRPAIAKGSPRRACGDKVIIMHVLDKIMGQMSPMYLDEKSLCVLCELCELCGWIRSSSLCR